MTGDSDSAALPETLHHLFWDYDPERLSWEQSRHTIVLRLLQSGGMRAVRWLRERMTDDEIREFLTRRRGRGIDPRRLRFWSLVVGIPRDEVDAWVEAARQNPWYNRTHRSG